MELKVWNEYTSDEKYVILNHIFYYYGKSVINIMELRAFQELARSKPDEVLDVISLGFLKDCGGPTIIVYAMRSRKLEQIFKEASGLSKEKRKMLDDFERIQMSEFVSTLNNPAPAIPMTPEKILSDLNSMGRRY